MPQLLLFFSRLKHEKTKTFPLSPFTMLRSVQKIMPPTAANFFLQTETHCSRTLGKFCYPTLKLVDGGGCANQLILSKIVALC